MTPFLPCTYNDRNEVQQGHPKYTMLTNNIHIKTFYSWVKVSLVKLDWLHSYIESIALITTFICSAQLYKAEENWFLSFQK